MTARSTPVGRTPARSRARGTVGVVGTGVVVVGLLLGACSPISSPDVEPVTPTSTESPDATPTPPPTADPTPTGTVDGDVVEASISVLDGLVDVTQPTPSPSATMDLAPDADTGAVLTVTLRTPGSIRLTVPHADGGSVDRAGGSTAVLDAAGNLVVGLTAARITTASGVETTTGWHAVDAPVPTLGIDLTDPADYPLTLTTHLGATTVSGVEWGDREGGDSLAVTPSDWGRDSGLIDRFGWAEVLRLDPSADTPVMRRQFDCHAVGAPDKATWNLEPWRPDVDLLDYALARCNPT